MPWACHSATARGEGGRIGGTRQRAGAYVTAVPVSERVRRRYERTRVLSDSCVCAAATRAHSRRPDPKPAAQQACRMPQPPPLRTTCHAHAACRMDDEPCRMRQASVRGYPRGAGMGRTNAQCAPHRVATTCRVCCNASLHATSPRIDNMRHTTCNVRAHPIPQRRRSYSFASAGHTLWMPSIASPGRDVAGPVVQDTRRRLVRVVGLGGRERAIDAAVDRRRRWCRELLLAHPPSHVHAG